MLSKLDVVDVVMVVVGVVARDRLGVVMLPAVVMVMVVDVLV